MSDQRAVSDAGVAGRDRVCTVFAGILRAAQIAGWSDESLSGASGIPARTIKSYRVDGHEPSLSNAMSIGAVLGKDAINAMLAVIRFGGASGLDESDALDPRMLVAELLPHVSTLAKAGADGRFDHTELAAVRDAADHIIAAVVPISSAGEQH